MASPTSPPTLPPLTETESDILALYDELLQLQLELALFKSQQGHHAEATDVSQDTEHPLADDQARLLEAKAILALRDSVVENVVAVHPTLNAVHHATHASPVERDLLPYAEQRDVAATKAATLCSELETARDRLAQLEVENLRTAQRNTELASEVLRLAGQAHGQELKDLGSSRFREEVAVLESQVKSSRHRWKIMKGAASAIVAGSGIEWVRDERLRDLVLDPPE
ncbi:centromere protein H (CENP-H)-domain-containing protein [Achaetomium macrosporum]|uniref:Centromere protein H (CENP-H)-domain-containing protein n=1 Tax=Achaetomium macrosporum TaxID=79813 RepID=A0AAN7CDV7_9PEZI|nr:centromere protein H (CENP-H)-domain-containing protein [Achaetomium macrosporum]